jgi:hypothetical protein
MTLRSGFGFLGAFAVTGLLFAATAAGGCQSNSPTGTPGGTGTEGAGGGATSTTHAGGASHSGGSGQGGQGGAPATCDGEAHTVQDVATGAVGPGVHVKLTGVVAMSPKFLVSQSSKSGSCLWGVYVSAPGLTETAASSGTLVVDYGTPATIPDGGTKAYCPAIGFGDDAGDKIPNDVKPGDVLDVVGTTDYYVPKACASTPGGSSVAQRQVKNACSITRTGTATPPKPHVFTGADIKSLGSATDTASHDKWGGVKVRLENVTAQEVGAGDAGADAGGGGGIIGQYGLITLEEGCSIGDKIYYQGYNKKNVCHGQPTFSGAAFAAIEGFSYLNYCTWDVEVSDKCGGFDPSPDDCKAAVPPVTTCAGK